MPIPLSAKEVIEMPNTLKEMDRVDLINIERFAHILKGLSAVEFETLEILLDKERRFNKSAVVGGESAAQENLSDGAGEVGVGQEKG